jgi:hypothetical protein
MFTSEGVIILVLVVVKRLQLINRIASRVIEIKTGRVLMGIPFWGLGWVRKYYNVFKYSCSQVYLN